MKKKMLKNEAKNFTQIYDVTFQENVVNCGFIFFKKILFVIFHIITYYIMKVCGINGTKYRRKVLLTNWLKGM